MEEIRVCLNAVLPIVLIMAAGYLSKRAGLLQEHDITRGNKIVFNIFMPLSIFQSIYRSDFSTAVNGALLAFALLGVLAAFLLGALYTRLAVRDRKARSVVIQGIYRSNFLIIGYPLAQALVPEADMSCVAVLAAFVVPLLNVLAVICLQVFNGQKMEPKKLLLSIVKNPLIIASAAALVFSGTGLSLPAPAASAVRSMAEVASPMMLFLLGGFFRFRGLLRQSQNLFRAVVGRLIAVPLIFLVLAWQLGFRGIEFAGLIGVFASSTGVSSFTMAQQMKGDAQLAGEIVVVTSMLCPLTLFCWSLLFKWLGVL